MQAETDTVYGISMHYAKLRNASGDFLVYFIRRKTRLSSPETF